MGRTKETKKKVAKSQRHHPRLNVQLLVEYNARGSYLFDFCSNIGEGGVFLATDSLEEPGREILLTFTFPRQKRPVNAVGKVIWAQEVVDKKPEIVAGMGVQFTKLDPEDRLRLLEFLKENENSAD